MNKLPKLHLLASNDDLRPAMNNIHVTNGIATATDGHCLARIKVENIIDNCNLLKDVQIPKEIWSKMCESESIIVQEDDRRKNPIIKFDIEGKYVFYEIHNYKDKYPDYHKVLDIVVMRKPKPLSRISFNPALIQRIKRGCGIAFRDKMNLHFFGVRKPVLLTTNDLNGLAIIMPMIISDYLGDNGEDVERSHFLTVKSIMPYLIDPENIKKYEDNLETDGK